MGSVTIEPGHGGIRTIWIDHPARRNALDDAMMAALAAHVAELGEDTTCRLIILRGRGGNFCAGRDLGSTAPPDSAEDRREASRLRLEAAVELGSTMRRCGKPMVAVVEGHAIGVGIALALWCDFAIAADTASFAIPEVRLGIPPTVTAIALSRRAPPRLVADLLLTGRRFGTADALAAGIVSQAVAAELLERSVEQLAAMLLEASPAAIRQCKALLLESADSAWDVAMHAAISASLAGEGSDDAAEGLAAFRARRKPIWSNTITRNAVGEPPVP